MEKQKRWQFYLILAVIILTVYNILPTIFYYSQPLKKAIDEPRANSIALSIVERVNQLEGQSVDWLRSFCKELELKPLSIDLDVKRPQFVALSFKNVEDADKFRQYLPRAGALIPFVPAQLSIYESNEKETSKSVIVQRRIPLHFDSQQLNAFFQFSPKVDDTGQLTDLYRALVSDRVMQLGINLGGTSENAEHLRLALGDIEQVQTQEMLYSLAQNIVAFAQVFKDDSAIAHRYFATFTQIETNDRPKLVQDLISSLDRYKDKIKLERITLQQEGQKLQAEGSFLETIKQQRLDLLLTREKTLFSAEGLVKKHIQEFASGNVPWTYASLNNILQISAQKMQPGQKLQSISIGSRNPFIDELIIDWGNEKVYLALHSDLQALKQKLESSKGQASLKDHLSQLLFDAIASLSRRSGEKIVPFRESFEISLNEIQDSKSFLAIRLGKIAEAQVKQLKEAILDAWNPQHPDLTRKAFPVMTYEESLALPLEQQKLGLVIYAPSMLSKIPPQGFRMNSIYVIAKGLDSILAKFRQAPNSESTQQFLRDFGSLQKLLRNGGFFGYSGSSYALSPEFSNDFIFETEDYFQILLKATREHFTVHGTKRYGVLEFSNVEERLLTINKIETRMHEDLLKWRDDYYAAQLNLKGSSLYDVPPLTTNVFWDNFKLSFVKYFRGDERKILHWGLDLSGGKTVQIELLDANNRRVTDEADIRQGINELYNRVNKMGVSEVSIRQEGPFITIDFPGSQGLSAMELVKASSMYFHIVNEKFTPNNPLLADAVNRFLQEIWNEAIVTNRKSIEEINMIAWKHLYGESNDPDLVEPRSEAAKILYDNSLRLSDPLDTSISSAFNDSLSKIAEFRGDDFTDWQGQTHPLLIVFRNFALEGSNLENVQASYDPSKGNFLSFGVKGSQTSKQGQKFNA
ncbi:MAG: protein translocase subunit SecDF, partial [Anaerolineae bacterium]